jgi:uncharacterized lipoprotein
MKPLLAVAIVLFLAGCATDSPSAQEVHDQFQNDFPANRGQFVPAGNPENPNTDPQSGAPTPR